MSEDWPLLKIKAWRKHLGLTQEQVADCMGTDKGVISNLENGKRRWNATTVVQLSECFGCKPHEVLRDPEELVPDDTDILAIWSRVPAEQRQQARKVLETFAIEKAKSDV